MMDLRKFKTYECKHNNGQGNVAGSTESGYIDGKVRFVDEKIINVDGKPQSYISVHNSFFNTTLVFFMCFFIIALMFNIIFYCFVKGYSSSLIAPKIILAVFLLVGAVPVIVNMLNAPKKIKINISSEEFKRVIFKTRHDKVEFLNDYKFLSQQQEKYKVKEYYVNYTSDSSEYKNKNAKVLACSSTKVHLIENNNITEISFNKKNHNEIKFLYLFFAFFLIIPVVAIVGALANNQFEPGLLSVLIFFVVGCFGMFLPRIIARGQLKLLCFNKEVVLQFSSSKERNMFEKSLKAFKGNGAKHNAEILSEFNYNDFYKVNTKKKFNFFSLQFKINFLFVKIIFLALIVFIFGACIYAIILEGLGVALTLILPIFLLSVFCFINKKDINLVIRQIKYGRFVKKGFVTFAKIVSCDGTFYKTNENGEGFYHCDMEYTFFNGKKDISDSIEFFSKSDKQFCEGQNVTVCCYGEEHVILQCNLLGDSATSILSDELHKNKEIYENNYNPDIEFETKLKENAQKYTNKVDPEKPYKTASIKKRFEFATIIILSIFLLLPVGIAVSVIINNPGNVTQISLALLVLAVFCVPILCLIGYCIISVIKKSKLAKEYKNIIINGNVTFGFVTSVYTRIVTRRTGSGSTGQPYKYNYVKYKYLDEWGNIQTGFINEYNYLVLSNNFNIGDEIAVAYQNGNSVVLQEYTLLNQSTDADLTKTKVQAALLEVLPKRIPSISKSAKIKTEVVLSAYITYFIIFLVVSGILAVPSVLFTHGMKMDIVTVLIFILFSFPSILMISFSLTFIYKAVKKVSKTNRIVAEGNFAYAVLYSPNNLGENKLFKKLSYVFTDDFRNVRTAQTSEVFYQMTCVGFTNINPGYYKKMYDKNMKTLDLNEHEKQLIEKYKDYNFQVVLVAYTATETTIVREVR